MGEYDYLAGEALSYLSSTDWRTYNIRLLANRHHASVSSSSNIVPQSWNETVNTYLFGIVTYQFALYYHLGTPNSRSAVFEEERFDVYYIQTSMIRYGSGSYAYRTANDNSHHGSEWQYSPYSYWIHSSQPRPSLLFLWVACSDRLSSLIYLAWWYLYVWTFLSYRGRFTYNWLSVSNYDNPSAFSGVVCSLTQYSQKW